MNKKKQAKLCRPFLQASFLAIIEPVKGGADFILALNSGPQGFPGINNYPTVGLMGGLFGEALKEEGTCFDTEIEAIRIAHRKGLFTIGFVFEEEQARRMAAAGADMVCAHLGFTKGGVLGAKKVLSLKAAAEMAREIFHACDEGNPDVMKMVYGGPVHTPSDVEYMYDNTGAAGYVGGSSFERIPSEAAITQAASEFKEAGLTEQDKLLRHMLNYMNEISFAELTLVAHISRTHLSYLFKKEVGCTFPEYVTRFRINKAMEFMKQDQLELSEVSVLAGYKDYAHFSGFQHRAIRRRGWHLPASRSVQTC